MESLQTFILLQLDRIQAKPPIHSPGDKKPDLEKIELGSHLRA